MKIVWPGEFDMLARDDHVLRDGEHVIAEIFGASRQMRLLGAGHVNLPGLRHGLQPHHVRQGK
jgi:hypothetical protein